MERIADEPTAFTFTVLLIKKQCINSMNANIDINY